jgi:hypothetical protein
VDAVGSSLLTIYRAMLQVYQEALKTKPMPDGVEKRPKGKVSPLGHHFQ